MYKLVLPFIIALLLTASCKDSQPETGNIFTVTVSEGSVRARYMLPFVMPIWKTNRVRLYSAK